jgi:hypothetical protein
MSIKDIFRLIIWVVGGVVVWFFVETGFDFLGYKFPTAMAVFAYVVMTGIGLLVAYLAAGSTIRSYDQAVENYDRNHGEDATYRGTPLPEAVDEAHRQIANRVAWKFAVIAIAIFWGCVILRACANFRR